MTKRVWPVVVAFLVAGGCGKATDSGSEGAAPREPAEPTAVSEPSLARVSTGRLYLPTYSHIYARGGVADDLATTVSIRNVSTARSLVLESVDYYDTSGKVIERFVPGDVVVRPLETVEFFIATEDKRGGSGANVVVAWHADSPVVRPLVEAVMVRSVGTNQAYAFSTRAIEIPNDVPLPGGAGGS